MDVYCAVCIYIGGYSSVGTGTREWRGKQLTEMRKWAMAVLSFECNSGQPEPYKQTVWIGY